MESLIFGAIGLGGLYAISSQENNKKKEINKFNTIINNPDQRNGTQTYTSNNKATELYTDQHKFQHNIHLNNKNSNTNTPSSDNSDFISLSGANLNKTDFKHNNMVPFFGAKVRGSTNTDGQSQSVLDNLNGSGSLQIKKKEQGTLFRPEENIQWAHGQPNHSDFFQSRVNPSNNMSNIKPWDSIQVGPGLNNGFSETGTGGFNSGMESRKEWMPKDVNELRVKTNPKESFSLYNHEGPAMSGVKNLGIHGKFNKNNPDTYYLNSPERYLTTTGQEKKQTARAIEKMKYQNRHDTTVEYSGNAGPNDKIAQKAPENYNGPIKPHVYGSSIGFPNASKHMKPTSDSDYGKPGYACNNNNRNTTESRTGYGIVGSTIGAVLSPLGDMLRPSRKENFIGNIRLSGNVQKIGGGGEYVYNPNDVTKTTIKQTTEDSNYHLNVENQQENGYLLSQHKFDPTQRNTTNVSNYGNAATATGVVLEDNYRRQRNNNNKQTKEASIHGNMGMFNGDINATMYKNPTENMRENISTRNYNQNIDKQQYGVINTPQNYNNEQITGSDRIDPNLLKAFKNNPYTHSLQSYA